MSQTIKKSILLSLNKTAQAAESKPFRLIYGSGLTHADILYESFWDFAKRKSEADEGQPLIEAGLLLEFGKMTRKYFLIFLNQLMEILGTSFDTSKDEDLGVSLDFAESLGYHEVIEVAERFGYTRQ